MGCQGCKRDTIPNEWGDWCDSCGGVMVNRQQQREVSGELRWVDEPWLIFRHVATVAGKGVVFPIVFDASADEYGIMWRKKVMTTKCIHCGQVTPVEERHGLNLLEDIRPTGWHAKRGTFDAMLALIQPMAAEDGDWPSLAPSPFATPEELAAINMGAP